MRVLPLDSASLMTSAGIGTDLHAQRPANSSEPLQPDLSEQRHPSQKVVARKKAIRGATKRRVNGTQLLSGWKEIANYLHQGVRTVQRWEATGLPVRRVTAKKPSHVIAFAEDLDLWARSLHVPLLDRIEELTARISSLEAQIRSLKRQLRVRNRPTRMEDTPTSPTNARLFPNRSISSAAPQPLE